MAPTNMRAIIILISLLCSAALHSQQGFLFIKKGAHKSRTYAEGDRIHLVTSDGTHKRGIITLLYNDTIFINGKPVPRVDVAAVVVNERAKPTFPVDIKTMGLITAGAALTGVGLSLNGNTTKKKAWIAAGVIGYAPLLLKYGSSQLFYKIRRKKFLIGKKFRLQVLEFHLPIERRRAF